MSAALKLSDDIFSYSGARVRRTFAPVSRGVCIMSDNVLAGWSVLTEWPRLRLGHTVRTDRQLKHYPIHNETWWSEESAIVFHRHLRLIVRSIGTQGHQGMGKMYGVGEEGEILKWKKWRAGLQGTNISMDPALALCTRGLTGFGVERWRLKPAHILLETVVSAALIFASKG